MVVAVAWLAALVLLGWAPALEPGARRRAGFDLTLLLEAARACWPARARTTPRCWPGVAGRPPSLFYSYPPPVAQAMTLVAWLPNGVALVLWGLGATAGLAFAASSDRDRRSSGGRWIALRAVTVAPLVLAFAVAMLFGNLDAWYSAGLRSAWSSRCCSGRPRRTRWRQPGSPWRSLAIAKLAPGVVCLAVDRCAGVRGARRARRRACSAAAVVTGRRDLLASLAVGGTGAVARLRGGRPRRGRARTSSIRGTWPGVAARAGAGARRRHAPTRAGGDRGRAPPSPASSLRCGSGTRSPACRSPSPHPW